MLCWHAGKNATKQIGSHKQQQYSELSMRMSVKLKFAESNEKKMFELWPKRYYLVPLLAHISNYIIVQKIWIAMKNVSCFLSRLRGTVKLRDKYVLFGAFDCINFEQKMLTFHTKRCFLFCWCGAAAQYRSSRTLNMKIAIQEQQQTIWKEKKGNILNPFPPYAFLQQIIWHFGMEHWMWQRQKIKSLQ